jgi:hypothetical protein
VHWAHQVRGRLADGPLYVNLRGFDPGGSVLAPTTAVRGFLGALGVPPAQIPVGVDAQAALYRSPLAGGRMLMVLDNARDAAQVRPLLPGSAGCLAVATSRSDLTSLVAAEGACPLAFDLPTLAETRELLTEHTRSLHPPRPAPHLRSRTHPHQHHHVTAPDQGATVRESARRTSV